jgi:hypothetical protein
MKIFYLFIATALLACFTTNAQTWQWTHPEPNGNLDPNNEYDGAHDIEVDASGNVYVLGDYLDSLFLNNIYRATGSGSYLAKYDSTGNLLWYRLIIPAGANVNAEYIRATDLTVTAQGVFITGKYTPPLYAEVLYTYSIGSLNFTSEFNDIGYFVTKFNSNGEVVWNRLGTGQTCIDGFCYSVHNLWASPLITSDKNNNLICEFMYQNISPYLTSLSVGSGSIPIPPPTPTECGAIFVFKMNNAGTLLWSNYAYNSNQVNMGNDCNSLITDNNGNAFLYGIVSDSCAFGSNIFHTTEYIKNGNNAWSTFIAKISSSGVWQFAKDLINTNYSQGTAFGHTFLAVDNADNLYALLNYRGNSYGSGSNAIILGDTVPTDNTNTFLLKLNNSGNFIWRKGFGTNDTYANGIHFSNNALYIAGGIRNYVNAFSKPWYFSTLTVKPTSPDYGGSMEYFVCKANINGDFQWVTSFSSPGNFMLGSAVKTFNDNVYTCGYYRGYIETLGNLNGTYNDPYGGGAQNIFFGKLKDQYIRVGAVSATQVAPGCKITIPFTSNGLTFSSGNSFIAELSDVNWDFTNPTTMGSVVSTGSGVITATIPASLPIGTTGYKIRIRSADTLATGYNYYAYADTGYTLMIACLKPTNPQVSNITSTSARLSWTPPANCAVGYQLQYKTLAATQWTTLQFAGSNRNLTGLTPGTTYQWRVQTGCRQSPPIGSGNINGANFTTAAAFAGASIEDIKIRGNIKLSVQPNPANNNAVLTMQGNIKNADISVTDMLGKTVWMKTLVNSNQEILPVQHFSPGTYFVKVINDNETVVIKLIKQ